MLNEIALAYRKKKADCDTFRLTQSYRCLSLAPDLKTLWQSTRSAYAGPSLQLQPKPKQTRCSHFPQPNSCTDVMFWITVPLKLLFTVQFALKLTVCL